MANEEQTYITKVLVERYRDLLENNEIDIEIFQQMEIEE